MNDLTPEDFARAAFAAVVALIVGTFAGKAIVHFILSLP